MALSAYEKIQEIRGKADLEIKELKQQAVSEVVRRLADAKQTVRDLEAQYLVLCALSLQAPVSDNPFASSLQSSKKRNWLMRARAFQASHRNA